MKQSFVSHQRYNNGLLKKLHSISKKYHEQRRVVPLESLIPGEKLLSALRLLLEKGKIGATA